MICMMGTSCKGGIAQGLRCRARYWIIVGMKFRRHIVISVPGGSWEFLALTRASAETCATEGPTVGAAEGVWDDEGT